MIGNKNKEIVTSFFTLLESGNAQGVAALFADNGTQRNPYASGLFPEGVKGKDEIEAYWQAPIDNFDGMEFIIEQLYAMEDPKHVFAKFKGNITLKDGAGVYANDYYATFAFNDQHEITEYVEIFNPIVAARGFGLLDKIK